MDKIVYFDYCALALMLILLASTIFRRMIHGKTNRYFLITLICVFITIIFDIWAITLDNIDSSYTGLLYFVHSMYLFTHSMSIPMYITYLISLTDTWHKLYNSKIRMILIPLPIIIVSILLIINIFTENTFYMNADNDYTRGKLFPIIYIVGFFYAIYGASYICYYKKLFKKGRFWALMSMFILISVATFFQMIKPQYPVEMFATSVGLLFIGMLIQRPEENVDIVTGLHKISAYTADIKRGFANDKKVDIILINISNFDSIKDILGYDGTNNMLKRIATKFSDLNKRAKIHADLYYLDKGRFRFVIDRTHSHQTEDIASMVNDALKPGILVNHMNINLITYVCIAKCPEDIDSYETLMQFGEHFSIDNVYSGEVLNAKDLFKKEQYDLYNNLNSIIEDAITKHNFQVYYQPIFSVKENRFNSAEALLRLKDEQFGFIPPNIFIPAAEKSGAIHKIGDFVLDEVCQFIASDDFKKLNIDYIEINLSVAQCMHKDLAKKVLDTLKKYSVSPSCINLEITETAASHSQNIMAQNLDILTKAGVNFSLDDFGTGYSNMQRVASLPLNIVKLDRTFVNSDNNPKLLIVLENTIRMIKDMKMKIVAEGIETEQLVEKFSAMECEYIQGYYFSKPIPKNDFIAFIANRQKRG